MVNVRYIFEGWLNMIMDVFSDIKYAKEFNERLAICHKCDRNSFGICRECGCVVKAKTKVEDCECPIGKWKTISETVKNKKRK